MSGLGKGGDGVINGRSSAWRQYLKPKEWMRSPRAAFQIEGYEINLVGHEQHFKKNEIEQNGKSQSPWLLRTSGETLFQF